MTVRWIVEMFDEAELAHARGLRLEAVRFYTFGLRGMLLLERIPVGLGAKQRRIGRLLDI